MAAPSEYFSHVYLVTGDGAGNYTVSGNAQFGGTITDYTDTGRTDDLTQLGDISSDHFGGVTSGTTTEFTYSGQKNGGVLATYVAFSGYRFYTNNPYAFGDTISGFSKATFQVTCFVSGTMIRTERGDVAVEQLQAGDVAVTASGRHQAIRWLGHRTIACAAHPRPHEVQPIRIQAHAFGTGVPARDLYLSPGHPVLVGAAADGSGGVLVPIMCLVNGTSVRRVAVESVTYWHVELDAHDILLAEGLPAESYLDWGDRGFFTEGDDHALANPDFVVPGVAGRCRPVALDGPLVEAERRRLDMVFALRLGEACAWPSDEAGLAY